jgi:hypothetical protein
MCDYSLHAHSTRLAQVGEDLVVHSFPGGSLGMASPNDLSRIRCDSSQPIWKRATAKLVDWFYMPCESRVPAVCIPPGSQLRLTDIPTRQQKAFGIQSEELVTFDQTSVEAYTHRDAIRFANGRSVLIQRLTPGQRVEVVSLASEPVSARQLERVPAPAL